MLTLWIPIRKWYGLEEMNIFPRFLVFLNAISFIPFGIHIFHSSQFVHYWCILFIRKNIRFFCLFFLCIFYFRPKWIILCLAHDLLQILFLDLALVDFQNDRLILYNAKRAAVSRSRLNVLETIQNSFFWFGIVSPTIERYSKFFASKRPHRELLSTLNSLYPDNGQYFMTKTTIE